MLQVFFKRTPYLLAYLGRFLCRFLRRLFLRLCVAILWRLRFRPQGIYEMLFVKLLQTEFER
jgi:hypothetical protein